MTEQATTDKPCVPALAASQAAAVGYAAVPRSTTVRVLASRRSPAVPAVWRAMRARAGARGNEKGNREEGAAAAAAPARGGGL